MENLAEIAEFLSSNPAIHWMSENPLETAGYAISAAGTFSFARAFQGGLNTYKEYKAALEDRNIDRYNEIQEDYQGTLEEL